MALIKNKRLAEDRWVVADEDPFFVGENHPLFISLEQWRAFGADLKNRSGLLGLRLEAGETPSDIAADLEHFAAVALAFPKFTDGRAYSYARLLRERFDFPGEIRAYGNVLRDQLDLMLRCGFDAFEVSDEAKAKDWIKAFGELSLPYQPASVKEVPVWALRQKKAAASAPSIAAE